MTRLPVLTAQARDNLASLHARVDAFFARVHAVHGEAMECRRGCASCCQQDLTLSPMELARALLALEDLDEASLLRLGERTKSGPACVFLEDDACVIYEARPTICRSHGLVIRVRELGEDHRDACPLNFTGPSGVHGVPLDDVLDVDRLNQMLALINRLAMPEGHDQRHPLRETTRRWLEARGVA